MSTLYEINTRVWLGELSRRSARKLTLAEVPDGEIDRLADLGFDLVWLMGVFGVGEKAVEVARSHPGLNQEYRRVLPDFRPEDVIGSPYAVGDYQVDRGLGGPAALASLRARLKKRGLGLILDFVPNHTALDHPWVRQRPELYVQGTREDLEKEPENWFQADTVRGKLVVAHGRDPYFPGWTDSAQLNFLNRSTRECLIEVLHSIAGQCDGVRCDMAILPLEEVFRKTWGPRAARTAGDRPAEGEFWPEAIQTVRRRAPRFLFIAEAYWGLEGELQLQGFDFTYDKTFYDRLVHGSAPLVRAHLAAPLEHQRSSLRFLENHDEARAAAALPLLRHRAAALLLSTAPGLKLFHQGQLEGRRVRVPVQLGRGPDEPVDGSLRSFYDRLLRALRDPVLREGEFRLLKARPAWDGNPTWESFLAYDWSSVRGRRLVTVNFGPTQGQCYLDLGLGALEGKTVDLTDLLGEARYRRDGGEIARKGLYLDLPPFGLHLFQVEIA